MPPDRPGYIDVDALLPQISLEQVAAYYGVELPQLRQVGNEVRTRCFLACGRTGETGDRALAVLADHPAKQWKCHHYGCPHGGNLVSLCDLLKSGDSMAGKPRGARFKAIAADLQAIVQGTTAHPHSVAAPVATSIIPSPAPTEKPRNIPLTQSSNERARALVDLDKKFVVDPSGMSPPAASYFRRRPFLSPAACHKWRLGYFPRDSGGDKSGGTMRGSVVYPLFSEEGLLLTWFSRDPGFEEKKRQWEAVGRSGREPEKFHFVKGFHRGLELFGQQSERLKEPGYREFVRDIGILVVEGPNDVIALDVLGVPAVGLMSNIVADEQAEKLVRWARNLSRNRIVLMLDLDREGEAGMQHALIALAPRSDVRLAWSSASHDGRFKGRQPESLTADEWELIRTELRRA
jgi:hypothetical protein